MNKQRSAALVRERGRGSGGSGLLHNMSTAPRSQIQYKSPYRRVNTRGIVFALPAQPDPIAELLVQVGEGEAGPSSPIRRSRRSETESMNMPGP